VSQWTNITDKLPNWGDTVRVLTLGGIGSGTACFSTNGDWFDAGVEARRLNGVIAWSPIGLDAPAAGWTPVGEGLPDKEGMYLVACSGEHVGVAEFLLVGATGGYWHGSDILAWRPLPAAYVPPKPPEHPLVERITKAVMMSWGNVEKITDAIRAAVAAWEKEGGK